MRFDKAINFSYVAPLMIFISVIGLTFRQDNKKIFYLPIGLMGVVIILEKVASRKLTRQKILKKIKSYRKFR